MCELRDEFYLLETVLIIFQYSSPNGVKSGMKVKDERIKMLMVHLAEKL